MPVLNPAGVVDAASLQEFMSEPAERLVAAAARVQGSVVVLGGSGKMGPDLVRALRRADLAAGVRRDVTVASTFSDPASRAELEAGGIRCLTGDLADPAVLASLPEAAHVIYLLGFKFGSGTDWRRAFHLNGIVPYLVGERYPEASIVALSSTNPLPLVPWPEAAAGSDETADLAPEGVYGWSIVAREAAFATTALRHPRQRVSLIRLSYAQHFAYGVMRDLAAMVWEDEPISLQVPAANLRVAARCHRLHPAEHGAQRQPAAGGERSRTDAAGGGTGRAPGACHGAASAVRRRRGKLRRVGGRPALPRSLRRAPRSGYRVGGADRALGDGGRPLLEPAHPLRQHPPRVLKCQGSRSLPLHRRMWAVRDGSPSSLLQNSQDNAN